jgi:hypothetical protein
MRTVWGTKLAIIAGAVGLAAAASSTSAATLYLSSVSPTASETVTFPGLSAQTTPYVGAINWSFDRGAADNASLDSIVAGSNLTTFCIEGTQDVMISQTSTFANIFNNPAIAPQDNSGSQYEMGTHAADLNKFWDAYYGQALLSNENAAAFQMGVWEIVYDGAASADFSSGLFQASAVGGDPTSSSALSQAQSWLAGLSSADPTVHYQLYVLSDPNLQDQLFGVPTDGGTPPSVPLPAAFPMGAALVGVLGVARKLRRR